MGAKIADGTEGKEDRMIDLLDLLGYDPLIPVVRASGGDDDDDGGGGGGLEKESRSSSFLGGISKSFPKVSRIFGCVGAGYATVK